MKLEFGKKYETEGGETRTVVKEKARGYTRFALLNPDTMEITTKLYPSLTELEMGLWITLAPIPPANEETVKSLRQKGWKVRVMHFRKRKYRRFSHSSRMSEKGGRTVVELTSPESKNGEGTAFCHPDDNYNKKEGVKIALSRALQDFTNHLA